MPNHSIQTTIQKRANNKTGLDGDSLDKYEGRDEVHGRSWRRRWKVEGLRRFDRKPNGDQ